MRVEYTKATTALSVYLQVHVYSILFHTPTLTRNLSCYFSSCKILAANETDLKTPVIYSSHAITCKKVEGEILKGRGYIRTKSFPREGKFPGIVVVRGSNITAGRISWNNGQKEWIRWNGHDCVINKKLLAFTDPDDRQTLKEDNFNVIGGREYIYV